jgi:hypothetical protein
VCVCVCVWAREIARIVMEITCMPNLNRSTDNCYQQQLQPLVTVRLTPFNKRNLSMRHSLQSYYRNVIEENRETSSRETLSRRDSKVGYEI